MTAFWISGLVLLMLLSGLPWAKFWGDYLKNIRWLTGTAVARQDWTNGSPTRASPRTAPGAGEHGGGRPRRSRSGGHTPSDLTAVDRVAATVQALELPPPVLIAPPQEGSSDWTAKSMTPNRPFRVDLDVDGSTGAIKSRKSFTDRRLIDKIVAVGIAAHEGRLFGWPNQLLGLLTAMGLIVVTMSSVVMWWRRREPGTLVRPGSSRAPSSPSVSACSSCSWGFTCRFSASRSLRSNSSSWWS